MKEEDEVVTTKEKVCGMHCTRVGNKNQWREMVCNNKSRGRHFNGEKDPQQKASGIGME